MSSVPSNGIFQCRHHRRPDRDYDQLCCPMSNLVAFHALICNRKVSRRRRPKHQKAAFFLLSSLAEIRSETSHLVIGNGRYGGLSSSVTGPACPCRPACHDPRTIVRLPSTFLVWLVWHTCTAGLQECMLDLLCIKKDDGAQVRIYGYMRRGKRCCCTICAGCVEPSSNMVKEMVLFWDKEFS